MSFEVIEKITQVETKNQERKAAAEAEAQKMIAEAEQAGLALLQQTRQSAAEQGKTMLRQAEERAAKQALQIQSAAQKEADALKKTTEDRLEAAVEFIVERVVKN
ncbi:hypothetical protein [Oscillibacter sp.]|uniref:hypothetical protein n=1 Tax=Oscillibacter sp. TaxID=1945593 RepID=UPI0026254910|nr:hypothetical protein [Oscillibacter sp.]MDD3347526.1 hypothetical protein [Oscillibacter sp.]